MTRYRIFTTYLLLLVASMNFAAEDKKITTDELPSHARFFLRTEFPQSKILSVIMIEDNDVQYRVNTHDNSKFFFDDEGMWVNLECPEIGVPSFVIPQKIQTAVRKNCGPKTKVVQLKKISRGRYDVELSNGFGLRFDKKMEIIDVRDKSLMTQVQH